MRYFFYTLLLSAGILVSAGICAAQMGALQLPVPTDTTTRRLYSLEELKTVAPNLDSNALPSNLFQWHYIHGGYGCRYCNNCEDRQPCHRNACHYEYLWYMELKPGLVTLQPRWAMPEDPIPDSLQRWTRELEIPRGDVVWRQLVRDDSARQFVWITHWEHSRTPLVSTAKPPYTPLPQTWKNVYSYNIPKVPEGYTLQEEVIHWR
ncbi:MAG: hypothetical protein KF690_10585 [Bacteroidetes bacterium]|nr:hypothetical protein [Bacteroidota bacterium]